MHMRLYFQPGVSTVTSEHQRQATTDAYAGQYNGARGPTWSRLRIWHTSGVVYHSVE